MNMTREEPRTMGHSTQSTNLADLLERLLDKGVVISGDIRIKLVDIELLTIQIRLVICSVDRAVEMGMDWWRHNQYFQKGTSEDGSQLARIADRLDSLEQRLNTLPADSRQPDAAVVPVPIPDIYPQALLQDYPQQRVDGKPVIKSVLKPVGARGAKKGKRGSVP